MQISRIERAVVFGALACLAIGCSSSAFVGNASKPTVVIQSPANGDQASEGEEIAVQSVANDPAGVTSVDLIVDGMTARTDSVPNKSGEKLVSLTQKWKATAGTHTIGVRAFNASGVSSDPVTVMVFVVASAAVAAAPTTGSLPTPEAIPAPSETAAPTSSPTLEPGASEAPLELPTPENPAAPPLGSPTPDGGGSGRIAFVSNRDGSLGIYSMNADGSDVVRLTQNSNVNTEPDWSPDGSRLAFSTDRDGNWEIYVMNADGSAPTRVTNNPSFDDQPSWSPDATRIAFSSDRDVNHGIYITNSDGTGVAPLPNTVDGDKFPAWSPDGAQIAFVSSRDGNDEIYVVNTDGSGLARLTNSPEDDWRPAWSPDGEMIAFDSRRDGTGEIYAMNADGSSQTRLTSGPGDYSAPAWSPDGSLIAFDSQDAGGNTDICTLMPGETSQMCVTNQPGMDGFPAWQPAPSTTVVVPPPPAVAPATPSPTIVPATPTLELAGGVYVTDVHTEPAQPKQRESVSFHVTFLNNIGQTAIMKWYVRVFEPDKKQSFGETTKIESQIPVGASELSTEATWKPGGGVPCKDFIARVFWVDAQGTTEYPKPGGDTFQYYFTVCP